MRKVTFMLSLVLLLGAVVSAAAQSNDAAMQQSPPKVLQIGREEVKVGKGAAHAKYEAAWTQAMVAAKYSTPFLAMTSVTGPNEAWWLTGFDSFAALETERKQFESGALAA